MQDSQGRTTGLYHPALSIEEKQGQPQSLALRYIFDPEQAKQLNRMGLRFLYSLQFPKEISLVAKECKAAVASQTASWLALGFKAKAAETKTLLYHCLIDRIFQLDTADSLPSRADFAAVVAEVKSQGLLKQAKALLQQLMDLLATRRQVQSLLNQSKQRSQMGSLPSRFVAYQELLDTLLPPDFLSRQGLEEAGERKRWLLALAKRIERAEHAPLKDAEKAKRVQPFVEALRRLMAENSALPCPACRQELALCRQMVEEFKISVFAPELGTAFPVSEKRIHAQMQRVEALCQRVET
jgi:ATP-dependent helicase HrpA